MRGTTILPTNRLIAIGLVALVAVALLAAGGLIRTATAAGAWYVDPAGNDGNTCKGAGAANACLTIQGAIGKAAAGDTINVAAGTFDEAVDLNKVGLTLVGAGAASTTIDYKDFGYNNAGMYVQADNVTVQDLTVTQGILNSTPRYGLKVGISDGVTIDGVTVSNSFRTGLDVLGASNITIDDVALTNNGGHGMQLLDVNGASVSNVTISGTGWNDMSVATWGQYSTLGTSGVVISGTNSFGGNPTDNGGLQLEEGNWAVPASPQAISWSTLLADGADVTIQPADFGYALSGPSDDGQPRTKFYDTLANAQSAAAGSPSHILAYDRFLRTANGLAEQTNYYVYDLAGDTMSIQAAIDAATGGDMVNVAAGTYSEQVEIDKAVTLTGAGEGSTFIQGFAAMPLFFVTAGPNSNHPVVYVHDTTGVVIEDLTVDGDGKGNTNYRYAGIGVNNAGVTIQNVTVINVQDTPFSGSQHGVGIYAINDDGTDRTVTVDNATVYDFQKTGIAINGANAIGQVQYSTVTGIGPTPATAQNGIQLGSGARGQILSNTVSGMVWTGSTWGATGILGSGSGAISIDWNDVTASSGGIRVDNYTGVTTGVAISDNTVDGNAFNTVWGADTVTIERNSFDAGGEGLWIIDSTNVTGSDNSFNGNDYGLIIDGAVDGVVMSNSEFRDNTGAGIVVEPYGADPINISITTSNISGNGTGLDNTSANEVLAERNWWGAATGADHATNNPHGTGQGGDTASDNVDFTPWYATSTTTPSTENVTTTHNPVIALSDTIQGGIDAALDDDTVSVAAGTYNEDVLLNQAGLTLVGAGAAFTTIDYVGQSGHNNAGMYVQADNVTVQDLTLTDSGAPDSTPRYGLKVGTYDGVTIDGVTVNNSYRTGLDVLGATNITIDGVALTNNGGHGMQLLDVTGALVSNVTISGTGWNDMSVATWGRYSPLGTSGVVINGTNSFGGNPTDDGGLQLEEGNWAVPASPQAISWSTLLADGADVTIQPADFGYALSGPSDDGQPRTKFYDTLANAQSAAAGSPSHIQPNDRFLRTTNGLAEQTNYYVYDLAGDTMSIQAAIDAATGGDMVNVGAGTYSENVDVNTDVTLTGLNPPDGVSAAVVDGTVDLTADGATVKSLKVVPGSVTGNERAIAVYAGNTTVTGNLIDGMTGDGTGSIYGIGVHSGSKPALLNISVTNNVIRNIDNQQPGVPYSGATGIQVQGVVNQVNVIGNTIEDIHSAGWAFGIEVTPTASATSNPPQNVLVQLNSVGLVNDGSVYNVLLNPFLAPYPGIGFGLDEASGVPGDASQVTVTNNSFAPLLLGAINKDTGHILNAENNWWGACDGPSGEGPGSGAYVGTNVDFDPWEAGKCDKDNDLLTDDEETFVYFTDPNNPDTDGDGCIDGREVLPKINAAIGGGRDPLDSWDFYDVNGDGVIDLLNDILGVVQHYSTDGSPPYDIVFDRGPTAGPNAWNMTAPDGVIDLLNDILGVIQQHGHDCT